VKQHTSAPTKALIAVDEMFFISRFLPRLREKAGKRSIIPRSSEPANEGVSATRIARAITCLSQM
jgi:hypothetical protein